MWTSSESTDKHVDDSLAHSSQRHVWRHINVTCDVSRTFADKRQETSLVSVCDANGHWSPDVPDCIGKRIFIAKFVYNSLSKY